MPHWIAQDTSQMNDIEYQDYILQGVSRTFALTIPQLPQALRIAVGNAYLLCRICDTIEDEASIDLEQKNYFADEFIAAVRQQKPGAAFAEQFYAVLTDKTPEAERDLIKNTTRVLRMTHAFNDTQQAALADCVEEMAKGMIYFQREQSLNGLDDTRELGDYCYYVAGVVGVMLTRLFCDYSQDIAAQRERLLALSVSFGQGLQMTNILKDIWDDRLRGACWLPRDVFSSCDFELRNIPDNRDNDCYLAGMEKLIGIATAHLRNALEYTLLIPETETGIRRFCFWALGMALLTLRKINKQRDFASGQQVKISRRSVKATIIATDLIVGGQHRPRWLFNIAARGLPKVQVDLPLTPHILPN